MANPIHLLPALLVLLVGTAAAQAQLSLVGDLRSYQGVALDAPHPHLVNRTHLGLQSSIRTPGVRWVAAGTLGYDAEHGLDPQIRELYGDLRLGPAEIRFGRFSQAFGRAEGLLMGDIHHTYDLSEFLTLDPEDLRTGIDGIRISAFTGRHSTRLILSPFRSRNRLPEGDWTLVPAQVDFIPVEVESRRDRGIEPGPLLASLQFDWRPRLDLDVDLALSRWHEPLHSYWKSVDFTDTPFGPVPARVRLRDTTISGFQASLSAEYRVTQLVAMVGEAVHSARSGVDVMPDFSRYTDPQAVADALRSENDRGFLRTVPKTSLMAGFKTVWAGYAISSQVFLDHRLREPEDAQGERTVTGMTASLWRRFLYDDLLIRAFARYQGKPGSWWVQPEAGYRIRDNLHVRAGAHLFGGDRPAADDPTFTFDRYRQNRFIYGKFRFSW